MNFNSQKFSGLCTKAVTVDPIVSEGKITGYTVSRCSKDNLHKPRKLKEEVAKVSGGIAEVSKAIEEAAKGCNAKLVRAAKARAVALHRIEMRKIAIAKEAEKKAAQKATSTEVAASS